MLTVAFLALGTLFLQEGFLRAAGIYSRYADTLKARLWADEKLWSVREAVLYTDTPPSGLDRGTFSSDRGKPYQWSLDIEQADDQLYSGLLKIEWLEGNRPVSIQRALWLAKPKKIG